MFCSFFQGPYSHIQLGIWPFWAQPSLVSVLKNNAVPLDSRPQNSTKNLKIATQVQKCVAVTKSTHSTLCHTAKCYKNFGIATQIKKCLAVFCYILKGQKSNTAICNKYISLLGLNSFYMYINFGENEPFHKIVCNKSYL